MSEELEIVKDTDKQIDELAEKISDAMDGYKVYVIVRALVKVEDVVVRMGLAEKCVFCKG